MMDEMICQGCGCHVADDEVLDRAIKIIRDRKHQNMNILRLMADRVESDPACEIMEDIISDFKKTEGILMNVRSWVIFEHNGGEK